MKIAMSLLSLRPGRVGGAETYVRQLVAHLPEVARGEELLLLLDRDVARAVQAPGWWRVVLPLGAGAVAALRILEAYTPWRSRRLGHALDGLGADVLFFPQQSIFPDRVATPAVVTVGDLQHLLFPENFGIFDRTFRARVYPRSMARARRIIAVSDFTRRTLVERCATPPEKVTVVPHGVEPAVPGSAPRAQIDGPYLLYPAATYPHKEHETLFRSFAALKRRGDLPARLVLTGERTRLWKRRLVPLLSSLGLERDVIHLGFVSRANLDGLYSGAEAVVFPTRFEGFGLPVLEAARFGRRFVTSRLEVFDEIGVPPHMQVDFSDPDALLTALRQPPTGLEKEPLRWDECARRTLDVLRSAARDQ